MMKIDVAVMTYNSERYLDECLSSVEKSVPINKLIVVDHHSTDRTVEIAKAHDALIFFENVSLGFARQLAIDTIKTPVFMFVDSDVVFYTTDWFPVALSMLSEEKKIGAVIMALPTTYPSSRGKYAKWWWRKVPMIRRFGFTTGSTLIMKKAIEGIRIPNVLTAREDRWIELHMLKKGWKYEMLLTNGIHYFDFGEEKKASWGGANERILTGLKPLPYLLMRRILTAPLKAIPPAIAYNDPKIIFWNTKHWFSYLQGWLKPDEYREMKRIKRSEGEKLLVEGFSP